MKRFVDILMSVSLLVLFAPVMIVTAVMIWMEDRHSPFYMGNRVGRGRKPFRMVKFRSMRVDADKTGVMSTAGDDARITRSGKFIRRFKLDELPQLFNVLSGQMSFVGPRPNVESDVSLYSQEEEGLLSVRPGITDLASIVFADEGEILRGSDNPDRDYNLLIRPWKSRLGLHLIDRSSVVTDLYIMILTAINSFSRASALNGVATVLGRTGASESLIRVSSRTEALAPHCPPGVSESEWDQFLPAEAGDSAG